MSTLLAQRQRCMCLNKPTWWQKLKFLFSFCDCKRRGLNLTGRMVCCNKRLLEPGGSYVEIRHRLEVKKKTEKFLKSDPRVQSEIPKVLIGAAGSNCSPASSSLVVPQKALKGLLQVLLTSSPSQSLRHYEQTIQDDPEAQGIFQQVLRCGLISLEQCLASDRLWAQRLGEYVKKHLAENPEALLKDQVVGEALDGLVPGLSYIWDFLKEKIVNLFSSKAPTFNTLRWSQMSLMDFLYLAAGLEERIGIEELSAKNWEGLAAKMRKLGKM